MGVPKALLRYRKTTFLETILVQHQELGLRPIVVLGEHLAEIRTRVDLNSVQVLENTHPEQGPLSSLKLALLYLEDCSALMIHPVDHPLVTRKTLSTLATAAGQRASCILQPKYRGRKGHPVLFPAKFFFELKQAPLSQGARFVVRRNFNSTNYLEVADRGILENIDTPERYLELFGFPRLDSPHGLASKVEEFGRLIRVLNGKGVPG
jgi:molybdenum cofactor cytidylyltransferase